MFTDLMSDWSEKYTGYNTNTNTTTSTTTTNNNNNNGINLPTAKTITIDKEQWGIKQQQ